MPGRLRNTKTLSQRIDRAYFKQSYFIPRWKWLGSLLLVVVALLWLGWDALAGRRAFNPGPLSKPHAALAKGCQSCHTSTMAWAGAVLSNRGSDVGEKACLTCHEASIHQATQTFTPACSTCHIEHHGTEALIAADTASCTQCHSSLKTKQGPPKFAATVTSFAAAGGHPEFAAVRDGHGPDTADIKFNHKVHMKADLRGPKGTVQLQCSGCHQPALGAKGEVVKDAPMAPVNFEKHCAECHPLQFDPDDTDLAPHKPPREVQDFVVASLTVYAAKNPGKLGEPLARRIADADILLFKKACKECHTQTTPAAGALPEIAKTNIAAVWMPHAKFDHNAHRSSTCETCHANAARSADTSDVNLPSISACRTCHDDSAKAAGAQCSECHVYHGRVEIKRR